MWNAICSAVAFVLQICHKIVPNYGVALLLFALIFKLILLPFGIKQQKNSIKQAHLRPMLAAIENKYKGRTDPTSRQKKQNELAALYQREGVNMMGGCLPMLIQLPLIFSLYSVIRSPLTFLLKLDKTVISNVLLKAMELAGHPDKAFGSEIDAFKYILDPANRTAFEAAGLNYANMPSFGFLGLDLTVVPSIAWNIYLLVPVITFATQMFSMWFNQRMTQAQTPANDDAAKSMQIMLWTMPIMSTVITFQVPSALAVYWLYQNLFGVLQQFILTKIYPMPTFTEEDYKEAERALYGKKSKRKSVASGTGTAANLDPDRPRPRSLHHIDDDEPDIPTSKNAQEKQRPNQSGKAKVKAPRPEMLKGVTLQEEDDRSQKKKDAAADAADTDGSDVNTDTVDIDTADDADLSADFVDTTAADADGADASAVIDINGGLYSAEDADTADTDADADTATDRKDED